MPLYEYQCSSCEKTVEAIQPFAAPPLTDCPECGESTLRKLLSAPAFQFKGSGWYVSDYARKGQGGNGKSDSGPADGDSDGASSDDGGKAASSESSGGSSGESSSSGSGRGSADTSSPKSASSDAVSSS